MIKRNAISLLILAVMTTSCSTVVADKPVKNGPTKVVTDIKLSEERDTALQAMRNMSQYLRSLKKFTVNAVVSYDEVLPSGQKVLLTKNVAHNLRI